jgi:ABC-type lipoprotein export system ATPase subunit
MRRPPAALRHVTAHRLAFTAVALTILVTTACATAIVATHDRALMDAADRVLIMRNGQLA